MKVIRDGDGEIVMFRHWGKWYFKTRVEVEFIPWG